MEAFKHIPLRFLDGFLEGLSIRIGLHQTYRAMETDRGDPLEGVAEYKVDRLEPAHEHLPEFAAARAAIGFPELGGKFRNIIFQDNTIRYVAPPAYLFCCSSEPDFDRCKRHDEAIVRIKSLPMLATLLRASRPDILEAAQIGPVTYEQRSVNPFRGGLLEVDPFRKSKRFEIEKEIRLAWRVLTQEAVPEYLDLKAPLAAAGFERIA